MEINSVHTSGSLSSPLPTSRKQASLNTTEAHDMAGGRRGSAGFCGYNVKGCQKLQVRSRKRAKVLLAQRPKPTDPPACIHCPQSSRVGRRGHRSSLHLRRSKPKQPQSTKPKPGLQLPLHHFCPGLRGFGLSATLGSPQAARIISAGATQHRQCF